MNALQTDDYLRQRLEPRPGDRYYIHLADLRTAMEEARSLPADRILDYGCGGSPYRALFPSSTYHRADLAGSLNVDFTFGDDSRLAVPDASYDLVLSTQVLEHVRDVGTYLAEARRILAPGGRLFITTHGTFPEHACPHDYHRWTADGLAGAIARAGFRIDRVCKLSTGPRALLFLLGEHHQELVAGSWSIGGICLRLLRAPFRWLSPTMERFADTAFPHHRVVEAKAVSPNLYVGLLVIATRT